MNLRPAVSRLMEVLVMQADREGVYWGKTTKEVPALTGLSPNTIRVAARDARSLGLLEWEWIKTRKRYPRRKSYAEPVEWSKGRDADNGGRVWVVQWKALGVPWESRPLRLICADQSRLISTDQSILMDLCGSSNLTNDPAVGAARSPAGAAPRHRTTAPGARATRPPMRLEIDVGEPDAPFAPPAEAKVASETPAAPVVSDASPHGQGQKEPSEKLEGEGRGPRRDRGTRDAAAPAAPDLAEIRGYFSRIEALAGSRRPGS